MAWHGRKSADTQLRLAILARKVYLRYLTLYRRLGGENVNDVSKAACPLVMQWHRANGVNDFLPLATMGFAYYFVVEKIKYSASREVQGRFSSSLL
jgi:hypothetical protein